ncbi:MAG TPA: amidohydrolase family protein [Solirubrobacteraceae bacterium]|jgi:predicted TIM-barrel fold metal-dependent hydrolase
MQIDVHQHLWTEPLLDCLAARRTLPFVRRSNGLTILHSAGEQPYLVDIEAEAAHRRASLIEEDNLDLALVALSSAIGVEALPRAQASELIEAHLEGALELPETFAPWGPVALDPADPDDVDRLLARGCVGISLPAAALAGPDALAQLAPLLARMQARGATLFVHPGPAPGSVRAEASLSEPLWWRPLTDYVSQMQAAWLTFAALGRREHPRLRVLFAMLAGGAPLLSERLQARGGPNVDLRDPLVFYDTSSFGPAAVETMARRVGSEQLVYGSDRPVVEPTLTGREALLAANSGALLEHVWREPRRVAV